MMIIATLLSSLFLFGATIFAHGNHDQVPISGDSSWANRHMAEEHHINSFDAGSFFKLHTTGSEPEWTTTDILRMYGLFHETTDHVSDEKRMEVLEQVLRLFDKDSSGTISYDEYVSGCEKGLALPDFGLGPGHHGDDEYEYEIHHFEKYHGDGNAKVEDLTHPEDIAHFKKHDEDEDAAFAQAKLDKLKVVESNIPAKFRRNS